MTLEILGEATGGANRLHALLRLASSSAQSNRPSRIANDAVATLNVAACIFHNMTVSGEAEITAQHAQTGVSLANVDEIAKLLALRVKSGGSFLIINDLKSEYPDNPIFAECALNCYLGVPIFDKRGLVNGVACILSVSRRPLDDEDLWWLEIASQLTSLALACETLQERISNLESAPERNGIHKSEQSYGDVRSKTGSQKSILSILVVDDDRSVSNLIKRFLIRGGYYVDCAADGVEALKIFRPDAYDLVITDIIMPGINGWELVASLHAIAPKLPVIIITGYSNNNNGVWKKPFLRSQGVISVLNKPLDLDFLGSILSDLSQYPVGTD